MLYSTCREPDYVAHGKKEIGKVEEDDTLLGVEEPGGEVLEKNHRLSTRTDYWNGRKLTEFLYLSVSRRKVTRAKRVDMRQRTARTPSQTIAKCLSSSENKICLPHLSEFEFFIESVKKIKMEREVDR